MGCPESFQTFKIARHCIDLVGRGKCYSLVMRLMNCVAKTALLCFFRSSHVWRVWQFSRDKKMSVFHMQRICVKFCVKIGKSVTEAFEMLKMSFGEEATCRTQTYEWWKRFKGGWTSVDDDPRSGWPSTSKTDDNVAKVRDVIRSNRRLTVRGVDKEVSISKSVCHEILTENLGMHRIAAQFVPRLLTDDQKQNRVDVSQEFWTELMVMITFEKHYYRRWDMGKRVRCRNESPIITVGVKKVAATKNSTPSACTRLGGADGIFWFWGCCSLWVSTTRPDRQ